MTARSRRSRDLAAASLDCSRCYARVCKRSTLSDRTWCISTRRLPDLFSVPALAARSEGPCVVYCPHGWAFARETGRLSPSGRQRRQKNFWLATIRPNHLHILAMNSTKRSAREFRPTALPWCTMAFQGPPVAEALVAADLDLRESQGTVHRPPGSAKGLRPPD